MQRQDLSTATSSTESSYVSPEEIGRLLVPHGGTTIMADPHEIVNVCGIAGLDYMMKAAEEHSA